MQSQNPIASTEQATSVSVADVELVLKLDWQCDPSRNYHTLSVYWDVGEVVRTCNPSTQEDHKFKSSLGYGVWRSDDII